MPDSSTGPDSLNSTVGPQSELSSATPRASAGLISSHSCKACGSPDTHDDVIQTNPFVYAIGRLEPRFPTVGVEKELAQLIGKAGTANLTDREAIHSILSRPDAFYLARQLCWILSIESTDAYVIVPRDSEDIRILLGALRPTPRVGDIDVVVGWLGPLSDGRICNGIRLPTANLGQLYSFDVAQLAKHMSKPKDCSAEAFASTVEEVFQRAGQVTDNMGIRDEHRAVNYLVTRDELLYGEVAKQYAKNSSLVAVRANVSPLSGSRKVIEVVLEFRDRETDVTEKRFANVDISDVFPFRMSKWSPYTDR